MRFNVLNVFLSPSANLVFHQTVERIHVGKKFGDIPRGIFIVRGENVVLLGEIVSGSIRFVGFFVVFLCVAEMLPQELNHDIHAYYSKWVLE